MINFFNHFGKEKLKETYQFDNFLDNDTCDKIIFEINLKDFSIAHQFNQGRHNKEFFTEDYKIISLIKDDIEKLCVSKRKVKAYSFPFEFYRYDKDDYIDPHTDSSVILNNDLLSNYTALIYLNDNYFGGDTYFSEKKIRVRPKKGTLFLFKHHLVHEAQKIIFGTKFIYRSNWCI